MSVLQASITCGVLVQDFYSPAHLEGKYQDYRPLNYDTSSASGSEEQN